MTTSTVQTIWVAALSTESDALYVAVWVAIIDGSANEGSNTIALLVPVDVFDGRRS